METVAADDAILRVHVDWGKDHLHEVCRSASCFVSSVDPRRVDDAVHAVGHTLCVALRDVLCKFAVKNASSPASASHEHKRVAVVMSSCDAHHSGMDGVAVSGRCSLRPRSS